MIPGAVSKEEFERDKSQYKGHVVIPYCTIGYRSGKYAEKLSGQGWDARNLRGSILAWTHAGRPLVDADGNDTKRVHVYGKKWDLAAEGYEGAW